MQQKAISLCQTLQSAGFEAYFAGGSVRDMLMDHDPVDIDIATSATPEEIEMIFPEEHFIPVGRAFGIMILMHEGHQYEIATFRSDSSSSDGRRPDSVQFTNAEIDAQRRDFTINGLFFDPISHEYHDFVGGKSDIAARVLRFIGDPSSRISEDHLRMLRGVRFKNRFQLHWDPATYSAIQEFSFKIIDISHERITDELHKILLDRHRAEALQDLANTKLLEQILPEVSALIGTEQNQDTCQEGDAFEHTKAILSECSVSEPLEILWAALLHDIGKSTTSVEVSHGNIRFPHHESVSADMAERILRRLKFPTKLRTTIIWLIRHHMMFGSIPEMTLAHRRMLFMDERFPALLRLGELDARAHYPQDLSFYKKIADLYEEDCKTILLPGLTPFLTGKDLIKELNILPGPNIRHILDTVWHAQLEEKIQTRDEALDLARSLI